MRTAKVQSQERWHQAVDSDSAQRDAEDNISLSNREASLQLERERFYFFQVNYRRFPILAGASNNSASFIGVTSDTPISSLPQASSLPQITGPTSPSIALISPLCQVHCQP